MDEMRIKSKFTTTLISKLLKMVLKKKLGYEIDIQLNEITATINDGKTNVHLDVDAVLEKDELSKIIKEIGLD